MIRAVTFDCWGTLIADRDMTRAVLRRTKAIADAGGLTLEAAADLGQRAWTVHHDAWVAGEQYGSEGMARWVCAELDLDGDGVAEKLCAELEEASLEGEVHPLEGAARALEELRAAGIRTALVCDTGFTPGRLVRQFLANHGIAEHLEFRAFSNEVGVPKPDSRIFKAALDAIGAGPGESVHVGDLLRTDIAGARAFGMKTIRIADTNPDGVMAPYSGMRAPSAPDPTELAEADEVIASHAQLIPALRRLGARL